MAEQERGTAGDPLSRAEEVRADADAAGESVCAATHTPSGAQVPSRTATRPPPSWWHGTAGDDGTATLFIVSPAGNKDPLKIRLTDDVSTLRALVTQM